jgi:hypothetical protein
VHTATAYPETSPPPEDPFPGSPGIDIEAAEQAAAALLAALGVPEGSEAALPIPARMIAGLAELLSTPAWEFTTFPPRREPARADPDPRCAVHLCLRSPPASAA